MRTSSALISSTNPTDKQLVRLSAAGLKDIVSTGGDSPVKWHGLPTVVVTPAGKSAVRPHATGVGYSGTDGSEDSLWWGVLSITGPYRQYVGLGLREEEKTPPPNSRSRITSCRQQDLDITGGQLEVWLKKPGSDQHQQNQSSILQTHGHNNVNIV